MAYAQNDVPQAQEYLDQALSMAKETLGEDHLSHPQTTLYHRRHHVLTGAVSNFLNKTSLCVISTQGITVPI
ncbi:tetratricopeptide repeat protein [Adonisia turfae]|uniref:tetratricopeptide repeat protein n=1 Tax=Adonisia turfae TaxID=2950184 RepID=UPI0013D251A7